MPCDRSRRTLSHVMAHIRSRLMDIGYTKEVLGAIVLTDDGLQRIATGK